MIRRGWQVDEANDATADKTGVADKPAEADEAVCGLQINKIGAAIESDESDVADEVDEADKSDKADEADEVDETGVSIEMPLLLPFSLTKYSAIFTEVKGSFGINNNQL